MLYCFVRAINGCISRSISGSAGVTNPGSNLFVDFRKVDLSPKLLENTLILLEFAAPES